MSKKEECYSCGYTTYLKEYNPPMSQQDRSKTKFCHICANTFIGNAYNYPTQNANSSLYSSLGYIGNLLLDEIRKNK